MTMTVGEELDSIFEYDKILEAAKKHFENVNPNDINFMSIAHCLADLGLGKYIKYHFLEKLTYRLREDLWRWRKVAGYK